MGLSNGGECRGRKKRAVRESTMLLGIGIQKCTNVAKKGRNGRVEYTYRSPAQLDVYRDLQAKVADAQMSPL